MDVILTHHVDRIGKAGERVKVSDGFSRNFLFPRRLAVPVTEGGLKFLEAKKKREEEKRAKEKEEASQISERIGKLSCMIKAKAGEGGKLFGSVTRQDIQAALKEQGFNIDKRDIDLFDTIHQVGQYQVRIRLHADVEAMLNVLVVQG